MAADVDAGAVPRRRAVSTLGSAQRVGLLVAPAGYGKTVAVRQSISAAGSTGVWLDAGRLHASSASRWEAVWAALAAALPNVAADLGCRLSAVGEFDRVSGDPLEAFVAAVERSGHRVVLVLDGVESSIDRAVLDDVVQWVECIGDRLPLLITSRAELDLPMARWRAAGWAATLTETDLRFDRDDALNVAACFDGLRIGPEAVLSINRRVEGWPALLQLALRTVCDHQADGVDARIVDSVDRSVNEYLSAELLSGLAPTERHIARSLSVVSWFDAELGHELAGPAADVHLVGLRRRRLLVRGHDESADELRLPAPLGRVLEDELRWQQPDRHAALHRAAATVRARRGDLNEAFKHLGLIGACTVASELIVEPALERFDRGDRTGLADLLASLPAIRDVDEPELALDIGLTWLLAGSECDAERWCEHAAALLTDVQPEHDARLVALRAIMATLRGELDTAVEHFAAIQAMTDEAEVEGRFEARVPPIAAGCLLAARDRDTAKQWFARARALNGSGIVDLVALPGLRAWLELEAGRLPLAIETAESALEDARRFVDTPHLAVADAAVTAVRCSLYSGDLDRARVGAAAVQRDAEDLNNDWIKVRSGVVAAEVELLVEGPAAARAIVADVRSGLDHPGSSLARQLDPIDVHALHLLGSLDDAREAASRLGDDALGRLRRASIAVQDGHVGHAAALLRGSDQWPAPERFAAAALGAVIRPSGAERALTATLERAAASMWTTPFLGLGPAVDTMLVRLPLERIHPRLARHLDAGDAGPDTHRVVAGSVDDPTVPVVEVLTPRERTVLELLPSHLSYTEIGQQLHISVNTVKPNVKAVYRKLGVTSRRDAVATARRLGLI